MNVERYLHRIGFDGAIRPDERTLCALMQAHLYSVPFENLDIHLGVPITLDLDAIHHKIVDRERGGFCYEVNGLFGWLLRELGFTVDYLSAQASRLGGFDPPFSHLVLRVWIAGAPYLVDVGYGDAMRAPMELSGGVEQRAFGSSYRLEARRGGFRFVTRDDQGLVHGYLIDLRPRAFEEFAGMCACHQLSLQSLLTRKRLCTMPTPTGRITLAETRLTIDEHGTRSAWEIADEAAYLAALRRHFGVDIPCMPPNKSERLVAQLGERALELRHRARRGWSVMSPSAAADAPR